MSFSFRIFSFSLAFAHLFACSFFSISQYLPIRFCILCRCNLFAKLLIHIHAVGKFVQLSLYSLFKATYIHYVEVQKIIISVREE